MHIPKILKDFHAAHAGLEAEIAHLHRMCAQLKTVLGHTTIVEVIDATASRLTMRGNAMREIAEQMMLDPAQRDKEHRHDLLYATEALNQLIADIEAGLHEPVHPSNQEEYDA